MPVYYNEHSKYAAAWLRELIALGALPDGEVDERSIEDVRPEDLRGFHHHHFFAGIGGWALATRLAGWPDDRPLWTGSPPCQPFSTSGAKRGTDDHRHLWPELERLVRQCKPAALVGEQVAAASANGWSDTVLSGLESEGYAAGQVVLAACSVGSPQKRDRLYFFAHLLADGIDAGQHPSVRSGSGFEPPQSRYHSGRGGQDGGLSVADTGSNGQPAAGNVDRPGNPAPGINREVCRAQHAGWLHSEPTYCQDDRHRPTPPLEPGLLPLADGLPGYLADSRHQDLIALLSGYPLTVLDLKNKAAMFTGAGNAIVPAVGAEVLRAFLEVTAEI